LHSSESSFETIFTRRLTRRYWGSSACKILFLARTVDLARPIESVHNGNMRTNVNLADDARQFAEVYAHANGLTLGDAITNLIREGQRAASVTVEPTEFALGPSGFPIFPRKGRIITTEMVRQAELDNID
jgi:hypothetical protein